MENLDKTKAAFKIKLSSQTLKTISEHNESEPNCATDDRVKQSKIEAKKRLSSDELLDKETPVKKSFIDKASKVNFSVSSEKPAKDSSNNSSCLSNPSWKDYVQHIAYEGDTAIYTDPSTQHQYTWDHEKATWIMKADSSSAGHQYSFENDTHVYTEPDGSKFFWDEEKKAWIPKVDEDFLALYQMSYGFIDNNTSSNEEEKKEITEKKMQQPGDKKKNDPQWFDASDDTNTKVYVSNLPLDITEEEFVTLMQKCGLVERDIHTQKMKVKLYMDKEQNCFKGDALCSYIKIESVELAVNLLDGSDYKGNKIKVERAHFQLKGEYNPALKPKKKKKKELDKLKKMQQKLFDWRPEKFIGERSKHERVVIIKNLFQSSDFDKDVQLILDYQQDLRDECSKCGEVRKVVIYDRHPEGVAQVSMKEPEQADAVVQLVNGRWFGKRQITAEIWDGRTKYRIAETDSDISKRIGNWQNFLEEKEESTSERSGEANQSEISVIQESDSATNFIQAESKVLD